MPTEKRDEVVVVTGASAGVGRAVTREFARLGARIGLIARGLEGLEETRREVEHAGGVALALQADVADPRQVEAAAEAVERRLGPIDIWVNNAMVSVFSPARTMTYDEFRRVTEVTYLGTVYGTTAALKFMLPRDRGVIVQVGSALAYRGIPLQSAYCGAKHATQGFTESLRCELLHDGSNVQVTMVNLPALNTPHFGWVKSRLPFKPQPVPPIFQPELAAQAIVYAAHNPRREFHVGMPTVKAITANKFIPGILDHYLARTGYKTQQTDSPAEPRADNLWKPVSGDRGAHGDFDEQARVRSLQFWASTHRTWLITAGVGVVGIAAAFFGRR